MTGGDLREKTTEGIDNTDCVIVFITEAYLSNVISNGNCKMEFNYAAKVKPKLIIPLVLNAKCRDTSKWTGVLGLFFAGELYVDLVNDRDFDENLNNLYGEINRRINLQTQRSHD